MVIKTRHDDVLIPKSSTIISPYAISNNDGNMILLPHQQTKDVVRSFRRVFNLVGCGIVAVGAWYGFSYLYWKCYVPYVQRKRAEEATMLRAIGYLPELPKLVTGSSSGSFNIEDVEVKPEVLENDKSNIEVILHQCPRGYKTPCISPFPFKLETFLRIARIPYEVDQEYSISFSAQPEDRNSPWLTIDGVDIVEAQQCIPELCEKFGIDLEKNATHARQTASRLLSTCLDYKIYWGIALWRWVFDAGRSFKLIQPMTKVALDSIPDVSSSIELASRYHGLGRMKQNQVIHTVLKDLSDVSTALGKHPFFLGETPGEVDCGAFALLSQMVWNMPGSPFEDGIKRYTNLMDFVLRMKEAYWPDWDDLLQPVPAEESVEPSRITSVASLSGVSAEDSPEPEPLVENTTLEPGEAKIDETPVQPVQVHVNYTSEAEEDEVVQQDHFNLKNLVVNQDKRLNEQQQQFNRVSENSGRHSSYNSQHVDPGLYTIAMKIQARQPLSTNELLMWEAHKRAAVLTGFGSPYENPQVQHPFYYGRPTTARSNTSAATEYYSQYQNVYPSEQLQFAQEQQYHVYPAYYARSGVVYPDERPNYADSVTSLQSHSSSGTYHQYPTY